MRNTYKKCLNQLLYSTVQLFILLSSFLEYLLFQLDRPMKLQGLVEAELKERFQVEHEAAVFVSDRFHTILTQMIRIFLDHYPGIHCDYENVNSKLQWKQSVGV